MSQRRTSKFPAFPASDCQDQQAMIQRAIQRVMSSGQYILGHEVMCFEEEFAAYLDASHCIGVGSGTDAIELMLRALEIGHGDQVVVPAHAPSAVAAGVERSGASVLLADVEAETMTLCPRALKRILSSPTGAKVKAALVVHLYGHPADWGGLREVADEHGIELLEDAAQAHGATWKGLAIGTLGRMAAFSFYPTKNLGALGDAGAVVTSDAGLAARLRELRQYGWRRRYVSERSGINSRLDELQAAVLRVKLPFLDAHIARRQQFAQHYTQALCRSRLIELPATRQGCEHAFHQFVIRSPQRERLREHLEHQGIPVAVLYPATLNQQPAWSCGPSFPEAEKAAAEILSLPLHPYLTLEALDQVIEAISTLPHASCRA
jgi:dTDP-4-amino-4,6-dideoxygalactose transaminase